MLKSIDVLIGLTVILLALSMAVTVITQSITTLLNSRGRHLKRGLTDLLQQLDPALTEALSKTVATKVLTHPLVSGSSSPIGPDDSQGGVVKLINHVRRLGGGARLGNVVHREEFTKLLMGIACAGGTDEATTALKTALANNGIANPDATLKSVRTLALQLEKSSPELSNMARQNIALLHEAESDLVAKINNWFDQTMDRTSQRFTASTRAITFAAAFIVAFGLQVDTPALVNRLAADDQLRAAFVEEAGALQAHETKRQQAAANAAAEAAAKEKDRTGESDAGAPTSAPASPGTAQQIVTPDPNSQPVIAQRYNAFLATNGIIKLPSADGWGESFAEANYFGLLITALLLSLGAPFWYGMLGKLLQLRSVLARKDDEQRAERQQTEPGQGTVSGVKPSTAPAVPGERGNLAAIG